MSATNAPGRERLLLRVLLVGEGTDAHISDDGTISAVSTGKTLDEHDDKPESRPRGASELSRNP